MDLVGAQAEILALWKQAVLQVLLRELTESISTSWVNSHNLTKVALQSGWLPHGAEHILASILCVEVNRLSIKNSLEISMLAITLSVNQPTTTFRNILSPEPHHSM